MAAYENQILVIEEGKVKKVGAEDSLEIGGDFTAGNLATGGALSADSAAITGAVTAGSADIAGALDAGASTLESATISGALSAGASTLASASVTGALSADSATVTNALSAGSATVSGALDAGASTLASASVTGALSADSATIANALSAGDATLASATVSGAVSAGSADIAGALDAGATTLESATVSGALSADSATITNALSAGSADVSGALSAGASTLASASVTGALSADSASVTNGISAASAALTGDLSAADGTFSGDLSVEGNANITGNIEAAGVTIDSLNVSGSASVAGNLVVQGDIVSRGAENLVVGDNFIDLNSGNTNDFVLPGGFTVSMKMADGFTPIDVSAFTAGGAGAPTFTIPSGDSAAFAAGDIVQISDSADGKNDGLFVVVSSASGTVTIKGVGGELSSVPFIQNQFTDGSGETAKAIKVDLAAFAANDGFLNNGNIGILVYKYATSATEDMFAPGMWNSVGADGVTLQNAYDSGDGDITLANGKTFLVYPPTAEGESAGLVFDVNASSWIRTWGAALDIGATGSDGDGWKAKATFDGTGYFTVSAELDSSVEVNGAGQKLTLKSEDVEAATGATLEIKAAGQIYGTASADMKLSAASGAAIIAEDSAAELKSIEAGADPEHAYASLRLDQTGSADLRAESQINLMSGGVALMKSVVAEVELARVELRDDDSSATIYAAELASIHGSDVAAQVENDGAFKVQDYNAEAPLDLFVVSAVDAKTTIKQKTAFEMEAGYDITAEAGVAKGEILCYTTGGVYDKQSNTQTPEVVGVATDAAGAQTMHSVFGLPVAMKFKSGEAPTMAGVPVYLSSTAGQATITAPTTSGRVYRLGVVLGASADDDGLYKVLWMPAFVADL